MLFIQTPMMTSYYESFHDVVFLDCAYNTNQVGLSLAILSGVSGEGKNVIIGVSFMAHETPENYKWLFTQLKQMNGGLEPGVIVSEFDNSMCLAAEGLQSQHLLCQWSLLQTFKKHFSYLSKRKSPTAKLLYNHIVDCIFCNLQFRLLKSGKCLKKQSIRNTHRIKSSQQNQMICKVLKIYLHVQKHSKKCKTKGNWTRFLQ